MIYNWEGVLTRGDVGGNSVGSSDGACWEVMVFVWRFNVSILTSSRMLGNELYELKKTKKKKKHKKTLTNFVLSTTSNATLTV